MKKEIKSMVVNRYVPIKVKEFIYGKGHHIFSKYIKNDIFNLKMYELDKEGLVIIVDTILRVAGSHNLDSKNYCEIQCSNFFKILNNDYSLYLDYLIENRIVLTDNFFIKGEKAKGYKINAKYVGNLRKIEIDNKTFNKRTVKEITKSSVKLKVPTEYKKRYFNDVQIDFDKAIAYMEYMFLNQIPDKKGRVLDLYKKVLLNHKLLQLQDNQLWISRSSSNGRVNSNITTLNGDFKQFLKGYNYNLDCTSSQPLCINILIEMINASKEAKKSNAKQNLYYGVLSYEYSLLLKQMKYSELQRFFLMLGSLKIPNKKELILYKSLCENGNLYEYFMEKIKERKGKSITRSEAKEIFIVVMYSHNNMPNEYKSLFRDLFPTIYQFLVDVKNIGKLINPKEKRSHKFLSLMLQGIESYIWIEEIAPKLSKMGIHYHTIHDSVIIKNYEDLDKVRYTIKESFYYYNMKPNICIEDLKGNKINID